jgi:O-antigen/teichoic acid export membrane protein
LESFSKKNWLNFLTEPIHAFQFHAAMKQVSVIVIAVALAKSGLPVEIIGIYETFMFIGLAATLFLISGLSEGFLSIYKNNPLNYYLTTLIISLLICLFLLFLNIKLPYWILFVSFIGIHFSTFIIELILLKEQRGVILFQYACISSLFHILVVALPPFLQLNFQYILFGLLGLAICKHVFLIYLVSKYGSFKINVSFSIQWIKVSTPLIVYALLGSLSFIVDGWLVQFLFPDNPAIFGVYRYGARELPFSVAISAGLGVALIPTLRKNISKGMHEIKNKSTPLFHIFYPAALILLIFSDWIYVHIFNSDFIDAVPIFELSILLLIPRLIINKSILIGLNEQVYVLKVAVIEICLNLICSIALGLVWGLKGIAIGTLIAFSFEKIAFAWRLRFKHFISISDYLNLPIFLGYGLIISSVFLVKFFHSF